MSGGGGGGVEETADQVQEQSNNIKLYNYQAKTYQPYIQKVISQKTSNATSNLESGNVKGQVNAEVMKGLSESARNPRNSNPVALEKQTEAAASTNITGQNIAGAKVRQRELGNLQNIVNIGRGQQTEAQQGQEQIAGQSLQKAIQEKQSDLQVQGATENAIGSGIGAAASMGAAAYLQPMDYSKGFSGYTDLNRAAMEPRGMAGTD